MLMQFVRGFLADLLHILIQVTKIYSLFILIYLFFQAIKESANNPNHWA